MEFLKNQETINGTFNDRAYNDQGGRKTIGYGHLIRPGEKFGTINQEQALRILESDVATAEAAVRHNISANLSQGQFDALTSFAYNTGSGRFGKSIVAKDINAGNFEGAANSFALFNKVRIQGGGLVVSQGLIVRREHEANLFRYGEY